MYHRMRWKVLKSKVLQIYLTYTEYGVKLIQKDEQEKLLHCEMWGYIQAQAVSNK